MIGAGAQVLIREPGRVPLVVVVRDRLPIGRGGDGLLLDDHRISRNHCELRVEGPDLVVEDLASSNGTAVNGERIAGPTVIRSGDEVTIGATVILVDPPDDGPPSRELHRTVVDDVRPPPTSSRDRGEASARTPETVASATGRMAPPPSTRAVADPTSGAHGSDLLPASAGEELAASRDADLRSSVVGGTITILFSDIVDSTALNAKLGDQVWFRLLTRHNDVLRRQLDRYQGTEVKGQGDGFMLTFPSSRHALLFGVSVQRDLERLRIEDPSFFLHVRIGAHTGEVIHDEGDIFGRHVNFAARVTGKAGTDEILVSGLVRDLAMAMGDIVFEAPRFEELKGFDGTSPLYPVQWR